MLRIKMKLNNKAFKLFLAILANLTAGLIFTFPSLAQGLSCTEFLCDPHNTFCGILCQIVPLIPSFFVGIGIVVALIFIAIYGVQYMTIKDDQKKLRDVKGGLTWSIVGLVILLLAYASVRLIAVLVGANPNEIFIIKNVGNCICN